MIAATGAVADLASMAFPYLGRLRRISQIIIALRRAIQGRRSFDVLRELRDFIDVLSDLNSALDKIDFLIRSNDEMRELNNNVSGIRNEIDQLRAQTRRLELEHIRLDCDNLPDDEGDGSFTGVGFGKMK